MNQNRVEKTNALFCVLTILRGQPMPKSACSRCQQNIEYDASYEGQEVVCPSCDNITILKSNEPDRSIPVASPIPSPSDPAPAQPAVPQPPASTARGPATLPPGVQPRPPEPETEPDPVPEAKPVTPADRIPAPPASDDVDDALPAKFAPGPRRKVAPARRPARQAAAPTPPPPPPPPPPSLEE